MFSGIIRTFGTLVAVEIGKSSNTITVSAPMLGPHIVPGDSVAHNGVCLTVVDRKDDLFVYEVMAETLHKTSLGSLSVGAKLNLEPALKIGDDVGGHMMYGHIDGVATVTNIEYSGESMLVSFTPDAGLMLYIVPQGSVAVDGVSLTVARVSENVFTVSLIQYTQAHTTLGNIQIGSIVNIECDMLAKYAAKQLAYSKKI